MRVLVTTGSKMGGTAGIAEMLGAAMRDAGADVVIAPAREAPSPRGFDAVVVGGALYANQWHRDARRFVAKHVDELREVPTWVFSSGPLDDSAEHAELPPPRPVRALMDRIGAIGHVAFGGRLDANAKGFPAAAMAKKHAGDWRNPERIRAWAGELMRALPGTRPQVAIDPPGRRPGRLVEYGVMGWALCAAVMGGLLAASSVGVAIVAHAVAAPLVFAVLAFRYHAALGARQPLPTALAWVAIVAALDLVVVAGAVQRSLEMFTSFAGFWLPIGLIFIAAWTLGTIASMLPFPPSARREAAHEDGHAEDGHAVARG